MAWLYLLLAALFEVAFAVSMKASDGFTKPWATLATIVGVVGGIWFLTLALRDLPVSIAYPLWVGAGAMGAIVLGVMLFGESLSALKLMSVAAIAIGVAGLKVAAQ